VYDIEIRYRNDTGRFKLSVSDASLKVTKDSGAGFDLLWNLFWRYKPNSCAFVCGMGLQDSSACDNILDSILNTAHLKRFWYPDSGMRPFPTGTQGNYINWGAQYFQYDTESDYDRAGEALHDYGKSHWAWNSGNTAYLLNYRGKEYESWFP
jgi:hypothetical protein